jgi:hypothetical protein
VNPFAAGDRRFTDAAHPFDRLDPPFVPENLRNFCRRCRVPLSIALAAIATADSTGFGPAIAIGPISERASCAEFEFAESC